MSQQFIPLLFLHSTMWFFTLPSSHYSVQNSYYACQEICSFGSKGLGKKLKAILPYLPKLSQDKISILFSEMAPQEHMQFLPHRGKWGTGSKVRGAWRRTVSGRLFHHQCQFCSILDIIVLEKFFIYINEDVKWQPASNCKFIIY